MDKLRSPFRRMHQKFEPVPPTIEILIINCENIGFFKL
jgi:hypothetical protein